MGWLDGKYYDQDWMSESNASAFSIKAVLSFEEMEAVKKLEPPYECYWYRNKLGKLVTCRVLIRRDNGEVVVENINKCKVCLTENDLIKEYDGD